MGLLVFWRPQLDITEDHVQKFAPRRSCWKTQPGVERREVREDLGRLIVPEGRSDRSLARSAWGKGPSKEPSRRVRYDRAQRIPDIFLVGMCAGFLTEGEYSS
jgi:hypothetical protein